LSSSSSSSPPPTDASEASKTGPIKRAWRRFRALPLWGQITAWVVLGILVLTGIAAAGNDPSSRKSSAVASTTVSSATAQPSASPTASSSAASPSPPPLSSAPPPSAVVSEPPVPLPPPPVATGPDKAAVTQWLSRHNLALVATSAEGYVTNLAVPDLVLAANSCNRLAENYKTQLAGAPAIPDPSLQKTLDDAKDLLYGAYTNCQKGFRKSDLALLAEASPKAAGGAKLLREILAAAQS
jgi:hypothetical protein